jgi:hypothetical protein
MMADTKSLNIIGTSLAVVTAAIIAIAAVTVTEPMPVDGGTAALFMNVG